MRLILSGWVFVGAVVVVACGAESEGSGEGGGGSAPQGKSSTSSAAGSYTCCLDDVHYACPDEASFDQCSGFDIDACMQACAEADFACQDGCFQQWVSAAHDPSECVVDPAGSCGPQGGVTSGGPDSTGSGPGASTSTGGCRDESAFCDHDTDCCSTVCTDGFCQESDTTCLHDGGFCETGFDCCSLDCVSGFCVGD